MADEHFDRAEFIAYFRDEAEELLHRLDADALKLEASVATGKSDPETVNALFRALHTIKGNAAMLGFSETSALAHGLENLCDLLRTERIALSSLCVELLLGGRDLLTALVASEPSGGDAPAALPAFLERLSVATQTPAESEPEAHIIAETPARAGGAGSRRQTIRVDIERLDLLLNLVGELVINRTRISDLATSLSRIEGEERLRKALLESAALLARTCGEIQESLMKVRMVPIGRVFERFPRLVRDIAKARGKEVRLEINGAQTELDKTIVDEIGEPLMHLLRNCIDHGIESPEVREREGKPRAGTISLNAYHAGNQVVIEIGDDGAGIDIERVRARAIAARLIAPEDRLSEHELLELIFRPGFSTAERVSELSGRGVGMDVVQKTVTRLKGFFTVESEWKQGTRFQMKLPLTLAIISALLVRIGEELYAIPLDVVVESQRIEAADIRRVAGNEVVTLRGQIVPLIRVAEFFAMNVARDPEKAMAVIVSVQGRSIGLVVDAFEGEQEIVIKPLSDLVGRIAGISGATILGSGAISLILDVHALVADAHANGLTARAEFAAAEA